MVLNLSVPVRTHTDFEPRISVIGVGGGGSNAVNNMIAAGLDGVEFIVANTDAQSLQASRADKRIQLGPHLTQGLGAGAKPEIGRAAAEEAADDLARHLEGAHMVFITAGMGGGTGTGAAPIIARMARERNILTVGVVTKPFDFEGPRRRKAADVGIAELQQFVDTLIVIPNQNLFRTANERTTFMEAFKMADNVLYMGVRGVTDLMLNPGVVNLDFADIKTVMGEMGKAMMGTGEAEGDNRAVRAAEAAISNPLLEDASMKGARGVLINITGGLDMTLYEVDEAANRIRNEVDEEANIIFGGSIDDTMNGKLRVSVVATGIEAMMQKEQARPKLVAVGGGVAEAVAPAPAAPVAAPAAVAPAVMPRPTLVPTPAPSPMTYAQAAPAPAVVAAAQPAMAQPVPPPIVAPVVPPHQPVVSAMPPSLAAAPQPAPQPAPAKRSSLFGTVTGLIRRDLPAASEPAPPPVRVEPQVVAEPPRPARPAESESQFEIPAFLRRQTH